MWKKLILFVIIVLSSIMTVFTITAYADTPAIPQWIKNNAKWWSDGTITDSEFLKGIQYLVQEGIIQVPVSQVTATNGSPSDSDRVTSIVVHFSNIQNGPTSLPSDITINSFQRIGEFGQTTTSYGNTGSPSAVNVSPEFQLTDLPSKDKAQFYQLLGQALQTAGQGSAQTSQKTSFDVKIDLITGDGTLLHTVEYDKCNVLTYWVYTDSNKQDYRMASEDQAEDREVTNFLCQGYHLDFPSGNIGPNYGSQ